MDGKIKNQPRIPEFNSYEEEAKWWDTHDPLDYFDEFEEVKLVPPENRKIASIFVKDATKLINPLSVRFEEQDLEKMRKIAKNKGIGVTTLVRMWMKEKLQDDAIYSTK